jgi:hypothetical protein
MWYGCALPAFMASHVAMYWSNPQEREYAGMASEGTHLVMRLWHWHDQSTVAEMAGLICSDRFHMMPTAL